MSDRHEVYYHQRVVPCECGSHEAYYHGPEDGRREYCCDKCWKYNPFNPDRIINTMLTDIKNSKQKL